MRSDVLQANQAIKPNSESPLSQKPKDCGMEGGVGRLERESDKKRVNKRRERQTGKQESKR